MAVDRYRFFNIKGWNKMALQNYRKMIVWQKVMDLVEKVYPLMDRFANWKPSSWLPAGLGYTSEKQSSHLLDLAAEVGRLINGLTRSLEAK